MQKYRQNFIYARSVYMARAWPIRKQLYTITLRPYVNNFIRITHELCKARV